MEHARGALDEMRLGVVGDAQLLARVVGSEHEDIRHLPVDLFLLDPRRHHIGDLRHQLHGGFGGVVLAERERELGERQALERVEQRVVRRIVVGDLQVGERVRRVRRRDLSAREAEIKPAQRHHRATPRGEEELRGDLARELVASIARRADARRHLDLEAAWIAIGIHDLPEHRGCSGGIRGRRRGCLRGGVLRGGVLRGMRRLRGAEQKRGREHDRSRSGCVEEPKSHGVTRFLAREAMRGPVVIRAL